jgi:uncharacterized phage protein (TIGR02218 family)
MTLKVPQAYIDWIQKTNRGIMGHLYKFTAAAGFNFTSGSTAVTGANIAELIVPSDGLGVVAFPIVDWANGKIYLLAQSPGTIRSYDVVLATQSPIGSGYLLATHDGFAFCGDADPASGNVIVQITNVAGNYAPINRYDPTSLSLTGSFGGSGAFGSYPTKILAGEALVCVECNGVPYALIKESEFSGNVAVVRIDTMAAAGGYLNVVSGDVNNRGLMCRGASGASKGSVFLTEGNFSSEVASIHLWEVVILPGAETYNISLWPTPNPFISMLTIGTIAASSIDPSWTTMLAATAIGYDNADGNVLLDVSTNTLHTNQRYIIKVNSTTAAVMWATPVTNLSDVLQLSRIDAYVAGMKNAAIDSIGTLSGALTTVTIDTQSGLTNTSSDNTSGFIFTHIAYTQGAHSPVPVSGTPSSFTGWALINYNPTGSGGSGVPVLGVGPSDYFTDLDTDVFWDNILWKSNSLRFEGLQRKIGIGLSVDEQTIKIWASPTDTLFGANFLSGVEEGLLDGAVLVRYRIIWPLVTGNAAHDVQPSNPPMAVWPLFTGYISSIDKGGASHIELKVKSALTKLNVNMPRNYFQPGCLWTLFDQGCTLSKASFAVSGTITGGVTSKIIPVSGGLSPSTGADGNPQYAQGRLLFTSGVNKGLQVLIDTNDSTSLYLAYLLNAIPSPGDTILFFPGCSKTFATCSAKFNNTENFRGFDKVPPVMVSV